MICIAIVNSKGGTGKTTLASALAVRAAQDSRRVAMVDLDPQLSLVEWWERRGRPKNPVILTGVDRADEALDRLEQTGWDWAFFDGPPSHIATIKEMIAAADLVVIPMIPTTVDMLASEDAVTVAKDVGARFLVVFNDVDSPSMARTARALLEKAEVPLADTEIISRVAYKRGMNAGKSAPETGDAKAAEEIEALWLEIKSAAQKAARAKRREGGRS